jgi:hypothetical protein
MSCIHGLTYVQCDDNNTVVTSSSIVPITTTSSSNVICTGNICSIIDTPYISATPYQTQENKEMSNCGITVDCTVPSYAWHGADFALHCIGLAIIILVCTMAYEAYKRWESFKGKK